jgi:hypothetical protein
MTIADVRKKLHDYIEQADDERLKVFYALFENDINTESAIDEGLVKELDKRWESYSSGKSKTYTLEESKEQIKKHRANKKNNAA